MYVANAGTNQILSRADERARDRTRHRRERQPGLFGDGGPANSRPWTCVGARHHDQRPQVTANLIRLANGDPGFTDTNNDRLRMLSFPAQPVSGPGPRPIGP